MLECYNLIFAVSENFFESFHSCIAQVFCDLDFHSQVDLRAELKLNFITFPFFEAYMWNKIAIRAAVELLK